MKKILTLVATVAAFACLAAFGLTTSLGFSHPPIDDITQNIPELNSAGDAVFNSMYISDATGLTVSPTDGGLATAVKGAPLTAGKNDGSGCITASVTNGTFTVAARCGVGTVHLEACVSSLAGGNTGKTNNGEWLQNGSAVTTQNIVVKTEAVDAGAQGNMGCAIADVDAALNDTFSFALFTTGGTADSTVTKQFYETIKKVVNK